MDVLSSLVTTNPTIVNVDININCQPFHERTIVQVLQLLADSEVQRVNFFCLPKNKRKLLRTLTIRLIQVKIKQKSFRVAKLGLTLGRCSHNRTELSYVRTKHPGVGRTRSSLEAMLFSPVPFYALFLSGRSSENWGRNLHI